jgi:hypothetical protein
LQQARISAFDANPMIRHGVSSITDNGLGASFNLILSFALRAREGPPEHSVVSPIAAGKTPAQ